MAYLYRHIRLDKNEPFYIGIATHLKRAYDKSSRKNKIWQSIISKTDYEVEILFDDLTREQVLEKEKEFIALYGRIDKKTGTLCNLTDGGEGTLGIFRDENVRKNIGISSKKKWDIDLRKKQSINITDRRR